MTALILTIFVVFAVVLLIRKGRANAVVRKGTDFVAPPTIPIFDPTASAPRAPVPTSSQSAWVPPGEDLVVAGRHIQGGMLFVGRNLQSLRGVEVEPSLIVPELPVSSGPGAVTGDGMPYWPSYSQIRPDHRAAYLHWLATGRSGNRSAYIGYVFLFFYGLERRVLDERFPCSVEELSLIADEVERLLDTYENNSFQGYAGRFLGDVLLPQLPERALRLPTDSSVRSAGVPAVVRVAVQRCATDQISMPAELAYRWAVANPGTRLGTPALRCRGDFRRLFLARYPARFPDGLKIKGRARRDTVLYQPASASFAGVVSVHFTGERIPRTMPEQIPARLQDFVDECVADLDSYSRWIGRNAGLERTIGALALLPTELLDTERRKLVDQLTAGIEAILANGKFGTLAGAAILSQWPAGGDGKLGKSDYVGMAQLLQKLGYGLEPDVRFGGPQFAPRDSIVVYRLSGQIESAPSAEFSAAALLLQLAALVAIADGSVSPEEEAHLVEHLQRSMKLTNGERVRLEARFRWLAASPPTLAGIKKRVAEFSEKQREALGDFLVTIAGADGVLAPKEIETLQKIYDRIGIDTARLYSYIHTLSTEATRDEGPVTVIPALEHPRHHRVPSQIASTGQEPIGIQLNAALVEQKLQQSAAVAALLGTVFSAAEDLPRPIVAAAPIATVPLAAGLDAAHTALLRRVAERDSWLRTEFDAISGAMGLLPEGALDTLNEAAYEVAGGPVLEDGDPMMVDREIFGEMVS